MFEVGWQSVHRNLRGPFFFFKETDNLQKQNHVLSAVYKWFTWNQKLDISTDKSWGTTTDQYKKVKFIYFYLKIKDLVKAHSYQFAFF